MGSIQNTRLVGATVADPGAAQFIDENGVGYGVKQIDNKPRVSAMPYLFDIAEGNVAGHFALHKFGYNGDIDASEEVVWSGGGMVTYLFSAERVKIKSSGAGGGNDDAGGSGARTVSIIGLDANWDEQEETLTLDGTTPVTAVGFYMRVFRAIVRTAGATGSNEGIILVRNNADSATLAQIEVGKNQAEMAVWTVPNGMMFFMTSLWTGESNAKRTEVYLYARPPAQVFQNKLTLSVNASSLVKPWELPRMFTEKTDIEMRAMSNTTNASVSAGFEGWYE